MRRCMMVTCPLCEKNFENLLGHLIIDHKIMDIIQLKEKIEEKEKMEKKRSEFRKYVDELNKKLRNREISGKDFRELVVKWEREHK